MLYARWKGPTAAGVAAAAWLAIGSAALSQGAPTRMSAQDAGDRIYTFSGIDTAGKARSSTDYKGKIVLLDFWATWCPPCRAEAPNVSRIYRDYHAKGFEVLGVSLDRDQTKIRPFTDANGMPWPEIFDPKQSVSLATQFQVKFIPTSLLFDGTTGKIIAKDLRGAALRQKVKAAVAAIPRKK